MNEPLDPGDIGIIVLAAGASRRFQGDKRLAPLPGGSGLLEATLAAVPASLIRRVLVLRPADTALAQRFRAAGWDCCLEKDAALGMGHSLAGGIQRTQGWEGALVALGDMPFVKPATYAALQESLTRHAIVAPVFRGRRGNPVGFRRSWFRELANLKGDAGARRLLEAHPEVCHLLEVDDAGVLRDIDTREALRESGK